VTFFGRFSNPVEYLFLPPHGLFLGSSRETPVLCPPFILFFICRIFSIQYSFLPSFFLCSPCFLSILFLILVVPARIFLPLPSAYPSAWNFDHSSYKPLPYEPTPFSRNDARFIMGPLFSFQPHNSRSPILYPCCFFISLVPLALERTPPPLLYQGT